MKLASAPLNRCIGHPQDPSIMVCPTPSPGQCRRSQTSEGDPFGVPPGRAARRPGRPGATASSLGSGMAQRLEHKGEWIATLVHDEEGDYIEPPIVHDPEGTVILGREVLESIIDSGVSVEVPVIRGCTPERLDEIDSALTQLSADLGVPIGSPRIHPGSG